MKLVNTEISSNVDSLCSQFKHSLPFSHLVLDDFLDNKFAENLNEEFPAFDPGLASDESEKVSLKCVH